jgi:hypothetical protein
MIRILGDEHMREQTWSRQTTLDRPMRRRFLHNAIASRATEFRPYGTNHLEAGGDVFQCFGNILT